MSYNHDLLDWVESDWRTQDPPSFQAALERLYQIMEHIADEDRGVLRELETRLISYRFPLAGLNGTRREPLVEHAWGVLIDLQRNLCRRCGHVLTDREYLRDFEYHPYGSTVIPEVYRAGYACADCGYEERY